MQAASISVQSEKDVILTLGPVLFVWPIHCPRFPFPDIEAVISCLVWSTGLV